MRFPSLFLIFLLGFFSQKAHAQVAAPSYLEEWAEALSLYESGQESEGLERMARLLDGLSTQEGVLPNVLFHMETTLGACLFEKGSYDQALLHGERADAWFKRLGFPRQIKEIVVLDELLCRSAFQAKRMDKAVSWGEVWIKDALRVVSKYSLAYVKSLYFAGCAQFLEGDYVASRGHLREFHELYEDYGEDFFSQGELLLSFVYLSICHSNLGDHTSALASLALADALIEEQGENPQASAQTSMVRGSIYMALGERDQAIEAFESSKSLLEAYNPELDDEQVVSTYLTVCLGLAGLYFQDEELEEESLALYAALLEALEDLGSGYDLLYARTLAQYGHALMVSSDWNAGGAYLCQADDLLTELDPAYSQAPDFMWTKIMKTLYFLFDGQEEAMLSEAEAVTRRLSEKIFASFPYLIESEREQLWSQIKTWYSMALPTMALSSPQSRLSELCYNGVLQSKGILLNSSLNIDRMLKVANDESLHHLQAQRLRAKELIASSSGEGLAFSSYEVVDKLERRLLKELQPYGNFMADLHITADSVRRALKSNELAIEFLAMENWADEDTLYIALTLKRDYTYPHLYELCSHRDLEALRQKSKLTELDQNLFSCLWGRIDEGEYADVETIYFAADGLLYAIPIEYSLTPSGLRMMEKYQCRRLSSTRELTRSPRPASPDGKVVAYGHIDYNASPQAISQALESLPLGEISPGSPAFEAQVPESIPRGLLEDLRGVDIGFGDLKFSRAEIRAIDSLCSRKKIAREVYDSCRASEESVKRLVSPEVLHFATHGVYFTPQAARRSSYLQRIIDKTEPLSEPLVRSALILAGANQSIHGQGQSGMEDGFLTARDISSVDLRNTKLVVLSSCNSGLGDIGSDGVFGLQRGFKQAGAQTLLMSLVSVNDYAAYLFVKTFFENYFSHGSPTQALREAQAFIRQTEGRKWDAPQFWAPFILLDAIE